MLAGMYVKTYLRAKFWRTSKTIESLQRKTKAWASNFSENKTTFHKTFKKIFLIENIQKTASERASKNNLHIKHRIFTSRHVLLKQGEF